MFSLTRVQWLRRLASGSVTDLASSETACHFYDGHRLGTRKGARVFYTAQDATHAQEILCSHGHEPATNGQAPAIDDRAGRSLMSGMSDHGARVHPRSSQVAIRALTPGCRHNAAELSPTMPGYLVVDKNEAVSIEADGVLVVENLETFRQIHRYRWIFATEMARLRIVVIYRGDDVFRCDVVNEVLRERKDPVWSFPDLDPAGLGLASRLPRLCGVVLPWRQWSTVEEMVRARRMSDLFEDQQPQWGATLHACGHPEIQKAWELVNRLGMGLNQEALRDLT